MQLVTYIINSIDATGQTYNITFIFSDGSKQNMNVSLGTFIDIPNGQTAGQQLQNAISMYGNTLISVPTVIPASITALLGIQQIINKGI